ncbi:MAG TPA: hypothetical protein VM934_02780 [Pyrinomonadaceae bacterium]|jgi:hypothetical protein|nr:hypothetical protein [Pyrinomonadaceae bacterium]
MATAFLVLMAVVAVLFMVRVKSITIKLNEEKDHEQQRIPVGSRPAELTQNRQDKLES